MYLCLLLELHIVLLMKLYEILLYQKSCINRLIVLPYADKTFANKTALKLHLNIVLPKLKHMAVMILSHDKEIMILEEKS